MCPAIGLHSLHRGPPDDHSSSRPDSAPDLGQPSTVQREVSPPAEAGSAGVSPSHHASQTGSTKSAAINRHPPTAGTSQTPAISVGEEEPHVITNSVTILVLLGYKLYLYFTISVSVW